MASTYATMSKNGIEPHEAQVLFKKAKEAGVSADKILKCATRGSSAAQINAALDRNLAGDKTRAAEPKEFASAGLISNTIADLQAAIGGSGGGGLYRHLPECWAVTRFKQFGLCAIFAAFNPTGLKLRKCLVAARCSMRATITVEQLTRF